MDSVLFDSIFSEPLYTVQTPPTIVVNQPWEKIGNDERVLLSKILGAIRLTLDSVSIKHQTSLDLSHWIQKPKHLIYFGEPVKGLQQYEVVEANGVSIVISESLADLLQNDTARKKLWQALKKQFSV
jgi:DNA polymerase III psi subunit